MRKGLNVLIVHPGFTNSNIRRSALNKDGELQKKTPRKEHRMMAAEKVAHIILRATLKRKKNLILSWRLNSTCTGRYFWKYLTHIILHDLCCAVSSISATSHYPISVQYQNQATRTRAISIY